MTTLIGIKSSVGVDSIVLAADEAMTLQKTNDDSVSLERRFEQKIKVAPGGEFAIMMAGVNDRAYLKFMNDLMKYRIDIQAAIGTGYLREVFELNDSRPGQTFTDGDYVNAFVLATRYGNTPRLFECHPDGILEESGIVCLGSQGARFAKDYLERRLTSGASSKIRLADSICLAIHALDVAKRDVFTSGYDFAVVMPDQIRECGWRLNQELYLALSGYVNSVAHELDPDLYINNFPGKPPKE